MRKERISMQMILLAMMVVLASCVGQEQPSPTNSVSEEPVQEVEGYRVLADHLRVPWAIAVAGETFYVTERPGSIVRITPEAQERQEVRLAKPVAARGEGGLLGFVLAPNFEESRTAYAYHTYEADGGVYNRIVLLREDDGEWKEVRALLEGIPGSFVHNGGRLAIGPDRHLYAATGDFNEAEEAQHVESLGGKILRMTLEGEVPDDNPFPGSYVYSYGHRNPQGLAWDSNGQMYSSEHGPSGSPGGHDEINRIEAGGNYGWPLFIGDDTESGFIAPLYHTGPTAIAPSGTAAHEQQLYVAALRGEALYRYDLAAGELEPVWQGEGRIRDVLVYEGRIFVITNNTDGRGQAGDTDDRLLELNLEDN
ncbi:PQQ-dependent sugar dehydrogenase [Xylanibacillus composti]|uniref:Dehydrogenase n=1 Tax=Xylanibacillus composti TaxID=1572762 RepID=A0A8J4H8Q4_9BACL|nr:PQQ-dependent sugar dehydrogenase [Xylanibacillus composti]MDT9724031.1 PQQ-dependent sugar dehydrogenase [Xylanibacillus composti]GIQ71063.1 dehydrogenase [Xylanibacillus composti]